MRDSLMKVITDETIFKFITHKSPLWLEELIFLHNKRQDNKVKLLTKGHKISRGGGIRL